MLTENSPTVASATPICDALIRHLRKARGPLHVPGHQQGAVLPEVLTPWLGQAARMDLTELPGLDNLAQPEECILQSQRLAADYYGSDECLYTVNGSSAGVMAALMAVTTSRSTVLFLNPFHISAWHGLVHSGASALRLAPAYTPEGRQASIDLETVGDILAHRPEISAVFITSPTYQGDCADVAEIARLVHEQDRILIVDEAHGAHLGLIPELPGHSVAAGADIVIQSVHKMLPGLTQTAWIHRQGHRVNSQRLKSCLRSLQTSSPSYLLLASLDAAQQWLRTEGPTAARRTLRRLRQRGLVDATSIQAPVRRDWLKHFVPVTSGKHARELQTRLAARGLFIEYADDTGVLSILGLNLREQILDDYVAVLADWREWLSNLSGCDGDTADVLRHEIRRQDGLRRQDKMTFSSTTDDTRCESSYPSYQAWNAFISTSPVAEAVMTPREVATLPTTSVPLEEAVGRLAAEPLTPYPPGVPVIYPGEKLTTEMIVQIQTWIANSREVHGISRAGTISVLL